MLILNFSPYATTSLIGQFSNNFANNKNTYSAPNSVHYNNFEQVKMNIIENKMENILNNFNSPSRVITADKQVMDGELCTINSRGSRNRLRNNNSHQKNYSDKINVGDAHTWSTYQSTSQSQTNSPAHFPNRNLDTNPKNNSQIYLSSFGRIDKV
jgi:hypothetical protein